MKRLALAAFLAVSLTACGGTKTTASEPDPATPAADAAGLSTECTRALVAVKPHLLELIQTVPDQLTSEGFGIRNKIITDNQAVVTALCPKAITQDYAMMTYQFAVVEAGLLACESGGGCDRRKIAADFTTGYQTGAKAIGEGSKAERAAKAD